MIAPCEHWRGEKFYLHSSAHQCSTETNADKSHGQVALTSPIYLATEKRTSKQISTQTGNQSTKPGEKRPKQFPEDGVITQKRAHSLFLSFWIFRNETGARIRIGTIRDLKNCL